MTTQRELSNWTELVHQLDPEPVFDYLLQHRTLDQSIVDQIREEKELADRNVKLLKCLEELGNPAIELFINALRQSGQLHLASSLDVEHRIKPVHGIGYWEKQRYKGQVTISFQLVAAKVMVRKYSNEDNSPRIVDINAMLMPFKLKHSYENMTLIKDEETGPKAHKILKYSYTEDDEDRSCCWCCIPFLCFTSQSWKKKRKETEYCANKYLNVPTINGVEIEKGTPYTSLTLCDVMVSLPSQPSSPIKSGSTFFKIRKMSPTIDSCSTELASPDKKSNSLDRNSNNHLNEGLLNTFPGDGNGFIEIKCVTDSEEITMADKKNGKVAKAKKKTNGKKSFIKSESFVEINNHRNEKVTNGINDGLEKKITDISIMNVQENGCDNVKDITQKLSPPMTLNTKNYRTGMIRSETYELIECWKSEGWAYQYARDQFFSLVDANTRSKIVRYFEQHRSTLVLHVSADDKMSVCAICMTTKEVRKLREDYDMGVLHEDLVRCVDPQSIVDKMECCAIHLRTVINDNDFVLSYQELS